MNPQNRSMILEDGFGTGCIWRSSETLYLYGHVNEREKIFHMFEPSCRLVSEFDDDRKVNVHLVQCRRDMNETRTLY